MRGWGRIVARLFRRDPVRRARQSLPAEVVANLQRLYVGLQRDESPALDRSAAAVLLAACPEELGPVLSVYARRISAYDRIYQQCRLYEQWYAADTSRQTRENAVTLHQKKEQRDALFQALDPVIKAAALAVGEPPGGRSGQERGEG